MIAVRAKKRRAVTVFGASVCARTVGDLARQLLERDQRSEIKESKVTSRGECRCHRAGRASKWPFDPEMRSETVSDFGSSAQKITFCLRIGCS